MSTSYKTLSSFLEPPTIQNSEYLVGYSTPNLNGERRWKWQTIKQQLTADMFSMSDGQLPIGNSTKNTYSLNTLTPGNGIEITNGPGTITVGAVDRQWCFKNRIINGNMRIDQRNAGAPQIIPTAAPNQYAVDRWYGAATGSTITLQQSAVFGIPEVSHVLRATGSNSNTTWWVAQRIEADNVFDLAGKLVVLSFYAASNQLTKLEICYGCPIGAVNDFDTSGSTSTTDDVDITPTLTRYSISFVMPADAVKGFYVSFRNLAGGPLVGGQTVDITNVQLEEGDTPTVFEKLPIGVQLSLCQRYYEKSYNLNVAPGTVTPSYVHEYPANTSLRFLVDFKVSKRIVPSMTIWNPNLTNTTGSAWKSEDNTSIAVLPGPTSTQGFHTGGVGVTFGNYYIHYTASAEL